MGNVVAKENLVQNLHNQGRPSNEKQVAAMMEAYLGTPTFQDGDNLD